ncbi:MAG: sigma-54-dependent Fis family transcriptional regulator [Bdellovibrionaceae bacterium]|jgi:two-component system response regulator AtoC|nr:sigma-54-dependent Fis family transcriptional regulator [Pseudobdellovibrionaceae bacterium]
MEQPRVIFVDDESCFRDGLKISLDSAFGAERAFDVEFHSHPELALDSIKKNPFNVFLVFMDHHFHESKEKTTLGADFIRPIKRVNSYIEIVMMSSDTTPESLRLWLKNGADKFLYKEFVGQQEKLQIFITEALTKFRSKFNGFLGNSSRRISQVPESLKKIGVVSLDREMKAAADLVLQTAKSDLSVLIYGETGTGKELFARAIHQNSDRKDKQFRTIDCTQFKKSELIASELFGSEKGAFTGAESKIGLLEVANGGTVFLDEVHHLSDEAQAMLLRFIQDRKVRRVGGSVEKHVDVRLVFAAKPHLKVLVDEDKFLADLIYRMKQIKIDLPTLAKRPNDVEVLCEFFLEKRRPSQSDSVPKQLHPDSLDILRSYSWPGNVRELENLIERLSVLVSGPIILPEHIEKYGELEGAASTEKVATLESLEQMNARHENEVRTLILRTYQASDYNLSETSRKLGVARSSLRSQCQALGIWESMDVVSRKDQANGKGELRRMVDNSVRMVMSAVLDN